MFSITASEKLNSSVMDESENGDRSSNEKHVSTRLIEKVDEGGIVSTIMIAAGGIFVGIMMEVNGRKRSIQLNMVLAITGLIFITGHKTSDIIFLRFVGQLIIKFAAGMEASIVVYVAESYLPTRRAIFLAGLLPVMILGKSRAPMTNFFEADVLSEQTEAAALIIILIVGILLSRYCPESPVWLKNTNAFEPADGMELTNIRRSENEIDEEADMCEKNQESEIIVFARKLGNLSAWKHFFVLSGIFTKITLLDIGLSKFLDDYKAELQFTGSSDQLDEYQVVLFPNLNPTKHLHAISFIIDLCSSVVGVFVLELVDRKVLSGAAWLCVAISNFIGFGYEILYSEVDVYYRPTRFCFLPIICIWVSKGFLMIGGRMILIVMFGELFPASIRGFISGLLWSFMFTVAFFVEEFVHPFCKSRLSTVWLFAMYAGMSSEILVICAFFMPETRGRTLMEIEHKKPRKSVMKRLRNRIRFLMRLSVTSRSPVQAKSEEDETIAQQM